MKHKLFFLFFIFTLILFTKCEKDSALEEGANEEIADTAVHEEASDYIWDNSQVVRILLNVTTITTDGVGVTINGSTATITSAGTYDISGSLTNGQILVNTTDEGVVRLILNGVNITNSTSAPIFIKKTKKAIVCLGDNKENYLIDGSTYVYANANEDEPKAALFSKADLTIFGNGSLTVKGNYNDGVSSNDGLIIKSGTLNITAKDDGIRGKDYLVMGSSNVTVNAGGQGLKSSGLARLNNTTLAITKSFEGIESPVITVNDATVSIISSDDCFNASKGNGGEENDGSLLTINGGNIVVNTTSGDGLDSNGSIAITSGTIVVHGPQSSPEVGMDYNGTCNISGGTLVISGTNSNMTQGPSLTSSQYSVRIMLTSSKSASTLFHIQDASGTDILTFKPLRSYYSIIFSSPALKYNSTYYIYTGGSYDGGTDFSGFYSGGHYSAGSSYNSFTVSSMLTTVGTISGGPGRP